MKMWSVIGYVIVLYWTWYLIGNVVNYWRGGSSLEMCYVITEGAALWRCESSICCSPLVHIIAQTEAARVRVCHLLQWICKCNPFSFNLNKYSFSSTRVQVLSMLGYCLTLCLMKTYSCSFSRTLVDKRAIRWNLTIQYVRLLLGYCVWWRPLPVVLVEL